MINQVMFFVGLTIFVVYVYFLLRIIGKQHRIQRKEHADAYDQVDLDGMGNQGRIPDKKPKNRAWIILKKSACQNWQSDILSPR